MMTAVKKLTVSKKSILKQSYNYKKEIQARNNLRAILCGKHLGHGTEGDGIRVLPV